MASKVILNFIDAAFLFNVEFIDINTAKLLFEPPNVFCFITNLGFAVEHQFMRAAYLI